MRSDIGWEGGIMGTIDAAALDALATGFTGTIITPDDAAYEETRGIFNAAIERRPGVIVQPTDEADVAAAIRWATQRDIEIGVRAGGHGVLGFALSDGGMTIDMRSMRGVEVDPDARVARVQGGANWGDFDGATQQHALGATGGRVSTTGVAGLTLGGGSGWIERKYGLACDNLRAVEMVNAAGELIRASESENADLFWASRGGGGNFGAVTALEFDLAPLGPEVFLALMLYETDDAEALAKNYREFIDSGAPEEVGGGLAFLTAPPEEFVPPERQGVVHVGQILTYCGPVDQAESVLAPLLNFGSPVVTVKMPVPYTMLQSMLDDPPGFRNYWSAAYAMDMPDEAIDIWASAGREQRPSPTQLIWLPWGGAVTRGPDTPVSARAANWVFHPLALWESAADDEFWIDWARRSKRAIQRFAIDAAYLNFHSDVEDDAQVSDAFGKDVYDRLAEIKSAYDPDNVFHLNNNIKPRPAAQPTA